MITALNVSSQFCAKCLLTIQPVCNPCNICVSCAIGEDVYIGVTGTAQDAAVRLDKSSLEIEDTYISLANQRVVTISNRSDVIAHFRWTRFVTSADEERRKLTYVATQK